ncbi:MAG: type II toxin-antitoxin system VapC family toxin [Candidatus Dormibacteraceae bacterium]
MILLDTTILVYAVGVEHPLRAPARALLELVRAGTVRATTTIEAIQECAHVRSYRRSRVDAATLARAYAVGLSPLVRPEADDLFEGLDLFGTSSRIGAFEAVLAATARRREWALASADRVFAQVEGLALLNPSSAGFLDEVRAAG